MTILKYRVWGTCTFPESSPIFTKLDVPQPIENKHTKHIFNLIGGMCSIALTELYELSDHIRVTQGQGYVQRV